MPFPGPSRKGLCGALAPSPGSGHIPGQRPGLLARAGLWAEARGRGGGLSMGLCATHKRPLWLSSRPPRAGPQSLTLPAPKSPALLLRGWGSEPASRAPCPGWQSAPDLPRASPEQQRGTVWLRPCTSGPEDQRKVEVTPAVAGPPARVCSLSEPTRGSRCFAAASPAPPPRLSLLLCWVSFLSPLERGIHGTEGFLWGSWLPLLPLTFPQRTVGPVEAVEGRRVFTEWEEMKPRLGLS